MHKEINNNIIYSTILLPELPSSAMLEGTPERDQRNQCFHSVADVLTTFLCVDRGNIIAVYGGSESSQNSSKIS